MRKCVFCQIVNHQTPCHQIYEDDLFFAFLDICPRVEGHTLVVPKKHYQWVYDVPDFRRYWEIVLKITQAMKRSLKPYFITYATHGLQVPHAHIHILPRKRKETDFVPKPKYFSADQLKIIAEKIKSGF